MSVGDNTFLDSGVIVSVESNVGENSYLYSGSVFAGKCVIGRNVTLGARWVVEPYKRVGKNRLGRGNVPAH